MRTIIDLSAQQLRELAQNCKKEHISRSEAIRQAVDLYLEKKKMACDKDVFGIWSQRKLRQGSR